MIVEFKISINQEFWYQYGKLHREDGPAVIYHGDKYWYVNGTFVKVELNDYRE